MNYGAVEYDPDQAKEAIRKFALLYFLKHGASNSNADQLSDSIYNALDEAERTEAFNRLSSAVERAFNRLRINGYRCEQDWQCCMSCGWAAIPDEEADHAVWYHSQDRAVAFDTGKLLLVWQGDAALIRSCLEAEGLAVEHDGTVERRIRVEMPS
ncbi:DUF6891 domain-containing protein [Sphingomonas sp. Leaf257]|jgi:hypothetical protein|uniref:DUF6891 domain-containing protein n=1 Tax=Sphingomonas sp. Leaf257 TaxID=1736309 RepID=UPI0006FD5D43|nr:hypothetical protein [Sphingomonas sp. Leaf257]KQO56456.1 hypothetical protein ASF14_18185 [Sphingomonas sp. Leaf257]